MNLFQYFILDFFRYWPLKCSGAEIAGRARRHVALRRRPAYVMRNDLPAVLAGRRAISSHYIRDIRY
jgi:hypothetical protein